MDNIEDILYRIINKYFYIKINDINYKIVSPGVEQKYRAHCLYIDTIENDKFSDNWLNEEAIKGILLRHNLWNESKESELKELLKSIDKAKIEYYLNFTNFSNKNQIKKIIDNLNTSINKSYNMKHQLDYLSLESHAQNIKNQYLFATMVYYDNSRVFSDNFEELDILKLNDIAIHINNYTISQDDIKRLARSELWRSYWTSGKDKIFNGSIVEWTDEQRSLVNFSKTLDAVREHLDAPSEEVINDDDALDGWLLYENEKIAKEKKQKIVSEKYGLDKKNGGEVFLLTNPNNREQTKEIYELNDAQTNRDIKEMTQFTRSQKGPVQWSEIPHVQRSLKQQINSMQRKE